MRSDGSGTRGNDSPEPTRVPANQIELLYFDGCPSYARLLPRLRGFVVEAGLPDQVELRRVGSEHEATDVRFLGSPTVRVAGNDVEPGSEARSDYGLKCWLYPTADGLTGVPPDEWMREALRELATLGG